MSKKIKIIFTLSIILNVLLMGVIGGHSYKRWSKTPYENVRKELSPESRHVMARSVQNSFRENLDKMKESRALKKEIRNILAEEEFDAQKFEELAIEMESIRSDLAMSRLELTKDLASKFSFEDRKKLMPFLMKGFHGAKGKNKKPHEFLEEFNNRDYRPRGSKTPKIEPSMPDEMPPMPQ